MARTILHAISRAQLSQLHEHTHTNATLTKELQEVTMQLDVILGRTQKSIKELLSLQEGSVITLNTLAGEPVELHANNKLIAKGEVVIVDGNYCIRILETN